MNDASLLVVVIEDLKHSCKLAIRNGIPKETLVGVLRGIEKDIQAELLEVE